MKATTSEPMLNITQNNNPLYKMLQPIHHQTATESVTKYAHIWAKGLQCVIQNFNEERRIHYAYKVNFIIFYHNELNVFRRIYANRLKYFKCIFTNTQIFQIYAYIHKLTILQIISENG